MAFMDYEAIIYLNGELLTMGDKAFRRNRPYGGKIEKPDKWPRHFHAVIGNGTVQLCGYKATPYLFCDHVGIDIDKYRQNIQTLKAPYDYHLYEGEIKGRWFRANMRSKHVDLWLTEPDGTEWYAVSGYAYTRDDERCFDVCEDPLDLFTN